MLYLHAFPSPLGNILAAASEHGLCLLEFAGSRRIDDELRDLQRLLGCQTKQGGNEHTRLVQTQLDEYFQGMRREFSVPLHAPGSLFQRRVWSALQTIPYGETTHYQALAEQLGNPAAVRAVAAANGANRLSITHSLPPRHRQRRQPHRLRRRPTAQTMAARPRTGQASGAARFAGLIDRGISGSLPVRYKAT